MSELSHSYDKLPAMDDESERAAALEHVREVLLMHGATDDEIDRAVADGVIDLFVVDRMLVPSRRRYTKAEVAELTGVEPEKLEPITNAFFNTQVLVVASALGVRTLDELAALSKQRPRTLSYVAPGAAHALFMEKWKEASGADIVRVPFRAGAEAVNG